MQEASVSLAHHTASFDWRGRLRPAGIHVARGAVVAALAALQRAGTDAARTAYLPLVARKAEAWTVLLDAGSAKVIGHLPLDSS
jgi:hypothetical protein